MTADWTGLTALVVDDEPLLRMEIAEMLEGAGFTVIEVGSVAAARRVLETRDDLALLFTDVRLWRAQEGVALAHEVARRWPPIAIVICSGIPWHHIAPLPEKARFIDRPYLPRRALRLVDEVLLAR